MNILSNLIGHIFEPYDILQGQLIRTDRLSQARSLIATTSFSDLAFFAGTHSKLVAIINIIFPGGQDHYGNKSDVIDIVNITTGEWRTARLSQGQANALNVHTHTVLLFGLFQVARC